MCLKNHEVFDLRYYKNTFSLLVHDFMCPIVDNNTDLMIMISVPSKVRNYADHLRSEMSFSRTCNIPNLLSFMHRTALSP